MQNLTNPRFSPKNKAMCTTEMYLLRKKKSITAADENSLNESMYNDNHLILKIK